MEIRPLRVAALNAAPVTGDVTTNLRAAARWCEEAASARAELLVFPEAWATGYDTTVFESELPRVDDPSWLAPLQEAVDRTAMVVLLNSTVSASGGRKSLTTILVVPGVAPQPVYDKQRLYPLEVGTFTAGDAGASIVLGGHEIGLSVCYDADFPEHAAAAAADGATIYVNSGAYFPGSEQRRDLRLAARALDNGMYVVFSGLAGEFVGGSAIYDPMGQPLSRLGGQAGLAIADIDPAAVRRARDSQRGWADRRTTLGTGHRVVLGRPAVRLQAGPPSHYLGTDAVVETDHPAVIALGQQLRHDHPDDIRFARAAFEWVRDHVAHAYDAQDHRVTLTASEVLSARVGLCYAKSNLLAAVLRSQGIPAGLCYQRLGDPREGHIVHGLVSVYLDGAWHRQDPRGNKPGVDAQFSLGTERVAYLTDESKGERDYPHLYVSPAIEVTEALQDAVDVLDCPLPSDLHHAEVG
ncbi:MAG: nitrilase-related carbon-nitrogen hydrolase [Nocardioides sp.]|uniref:nitrilase-related carbon-nitrogen hydrolase n=1 Tax=Nocardioides sp. TaxID=35761 RepID=UPI0039E70A4E